ncbi:LysM peptidoglycan-binding domain-containing protein [Candidatus Poriferisocius sp.]|uniref:LysM peptidoglycan-binding domain-containing protein n=1 Tax=Candidatus Poriferisocius sp. TaxID=3101276 RepID=UPI003B02BF24
MLLIAVLGAACGGGGTSSEDRPLGLDPDEAGSPTVEVALPTPPPTPTPTSTPEAFIYVVKEGDTLASIAAEFGTSLAGIILVNDFDNPNLLSIGQQVEIPQDVPVVLNRDGTVRPGDRTHIVVAGETLSEIAVKYDKPLPELLAANNLTMASLLQVGQPLIIPADEEDPDS